MAGFEIIVRPVIFPHIRPAPPQPQAPPDDPEKGFAEIRGNGGKAIAMSTSYSASASSSTRSERKRRVTKARVYQKEGDKINKENYIDIEVVTKIWMEGPPGESPEGDWIPEVTREAYKRIKEEDNIKILEQDKDIERG